MLSGWEYPETAAQVLVVILDDHHRVRATCQTLVQRPHPHALRLSTWSTLDAGMVHEEWWNERGERCGLQPAVGTMVA